MPFEDLADDYENFDASKSAPPADRCDMWKIYSPPRIGPIRALNGRCRRSIELTTFWDLRKADTQHCLPDVMSQRPRFAIMGPPCTLFTNLIFSNWFRMEKAIREQRLKEAVTYADISCWIAMWQNRAGDYLIENPEGSQMRTRPSAPPWNYGFPVLQLLFERLLAGVNLFPC